MLHVAIDHVCLGSDISCWAEIPAKTRRPFLVLSTPVQASLESAFSLIPHRPTTVLNNERFILTARVQRIAIAVYMAAVVVNAFRLGFRASGAIAMTVKV